VLPDFDNYPAKGASVTSLLGQIAGLQADRLIARNESSQARLEVKADAFQRRIVIERGDQTDTLYLGSSSGSNAAHARVNDSTEIYLTSGLTAWSVGAQVASWIDTTYSSVTQDDVVAIHLENANGTFDLARGEDNAWVYSGLAEGETVDPIALSNLARQVSTVRMTAPLGRTADPAWGMDAPLATIVLTVREIVTPEPSETPTAAPTAAPTLEGDSSVMSPLLPGETPTGEIPARDSRAVAHAGAGDDRSAP
jgi:hypothetical protein